MSEPPTDSPYAAPDAAHAPAAPELTRSPIRSLTRPLIATAAITAVVAACAWWVDAWLIAMMMGMLCFWALLWQMARLLYYLVRWNTFGLKLVGARTLMWLGAMFAAITAHNTFVSASQETADRLLGAIKAYHAREGRYPEKLDVLVPRDIPEVPRLARGGGVQKFHYRTTEGGYTLGYASGWMTMTSYDSTTGKWETRD